MGMVYSGFSSVLQHGVFVDAICMQMARNACTAAKRGLRCNKLLNSSTLGPNAL